MDTSPLRSAAVSSGYISASQLSKSHDFLVGFGSATLAGTLGCSFPMLGCCRWKKERFFMPRTGIFNISEILSCTFVPFLNLSVTAEARHDFGIGNNWSNCRGRKCPATSFMAPLNSTPLEDLADLTQDLRSPNDLSISANSSILRMQTTSLFPGADFLMTEASSSNRELVGSSTKICQETEPFPPELNPSRMPKHVAIIMDGNSRWARTRGLPSLKGHEAGVRALREVVTLAREWGIEALTVFGFSTENWLRPKMEVNYLMGLLEHALSVWVDDIIKAKIQLRVIGDISRLPGSLRQTLGRVEKLTQHHSGLKLIVALSYSGRQDIVRACKQVAIKAMNGSLDPADIDECLIQEELGTKWTRLQPDLLIRTSGEQRLSNFLLWELAYTELYFCSHLWPDFHRDEFIAALLEYQRRERRYGKRD